MTPDLLDILKTERREVRSQVALHVGRVLVVQPEQFADLAVADVLRRIPYTHDERVRRLAEQARVNPLRRGGDLSREQRIALARQLAQFAKDSAA